MELLLPSSNQLRPPTIQLSPREHLMDYLLMSGQKLHLQIMLRLPFSEHASHEEACDSDALAQNTNYFTFFLPPITLPHTSDHPASLPHKYSKPLTFREADLRLVLPSPCLAASWVNSSCCKPWRLSIWLLCVRQWTWSVTITVTQALLCFGTSVSFPRAQPSTCLTSHLHLLLSSSSFLNSLLSSSIAGTQATQASLYFVLKWPSSPRIFHSSLKPREDSFPSSSCRSGSEPHSSVFVAQDEITKFTSIPVLCRCLSH